MAAPPFPHFAHCTHLVVVCCHAVYVGDGDDTADREWRLQPFQQANSLTGRPSEISTMMAHIATGAALVERDPNALLVFSGGRTSIATRSEAEGYEKLLLASPAFPEARMRHALENFATDSYQNLLFSILRFHALTTRYPSYVTVVTHAFKDRRFYELHAPAIRWPASRIRVQGVNPPFTAAELEETRQGEEKRGYAPFIADLYGVRSPLADKRISRKWNPTSLGLVGVGPRTDDAVKHLLTWKGGRSGDEIIPEKMPWES